MKAINGVKECSRCREHLPVSNFGVKKLSADGLYDYCRPCARKNSREKYAKSKPTAYAWKSNKPPEYTVWIQMRSRCNNEKDTGYHNYGGRGIRVCRRWDSFDMFLSDMGSRPTSSHTIDRIDNDGDYCPENCRWATRLDQASNRRNNHALTCDGRTMSISEWGRETGIHHAAIRCRVSRGWTIGEALGFDERVRPKFEYTRDRLGRIMGVKKAEKP